MRLFVYFFCFFFFKQKTAYEMRISDWSSDVCSSDLHFERWHREVGRSHIDYAHNSSETLGRGECNPLSASPWHHQRLSPSPKRFRSCPVLARVPRAGRCSTF